MELGTGEWIWIVGFATTIVTLSFGFWTVVRNINSRETSLRSEMREMRTELQSDIRSTLGNRLNDTEREQARLEGVNSMLPS